MTYKTKPTAEIIEEYVKTFALKNFYDDQNYLAAIKLTNSFPRCDNYQDIYIKVNFINGAFKTTIADTFGVAKRIYEKVKNIDSRLDSGDVTLITDIAKYKSTKKKTKRNNYSFATKFCHCHKPNLFPINDRYVRNSLFEFNKYHTFSSFNKKDLLNYKKFKTVLQDFKKFVNNEELSFANLDRFLWALGRQYAKKNSIIAQ